MKIKKILVVISLTFGIGLIGVVPTYAKVYLSEFGSNVDSGGHLDWDYSTIYYAESVFAMNLWNTDGN